MQIITNGKQLELTPAIKQYVEKKIDGLQKYNGDIIRAAVTVGMETHHHLKGEVFYAECKMEVPGGSELFAKQNAKDVYAAIDILRDELIAELKKHKRKMLGNEKKNKITVRETKEYNVESDSEEEI